MVALFYHIKRVPLNSLKKTLFYCLLLKIVHLQRRSRRCKKNSNGPFQLCKSKGGYLAVIDSPTKQDNVTKLIKQHLNVTALSSATYLVGKKELLMLFLLIKLALRQPPQQSIQ